MQEFLTLKEVGKRLGLTSSSLYRLMDQDPDFRTFRVGGRRLMRLEVLEAYVAKKEREDLEERGLA